MLRKIFCGALLSGIVASQVLAGSGILLGGAAAGGGAVNDDQILWGSGPDQVSLDDVPNGVTAKLGQDASPTGTPTFNSINLTTGLGISSGGTGATNAAGARASLGAAALGANSDITSLAGLTSISDELGLDLLKFSSQEAAINELTIQNAAEGYGPQILSSGDDSDIPMTLMPKGEGRTIITNGGSRTTGLLIGKNGSGSRTSFLALIGDDTNDVFEEGLRLARQAGGINANAAITNAGAGSLTIKTIGSGSLFLGTEDINRLEITNTGKVIVDDVQINSGSLGGIRLARTQVADSDYTALITDSLIAYSSISAARVVTLPAAAAAGAGFVLIVKDESGSASGANTITVDGDGAETIDGAADAEIDSAYGSIRLYSNGSQWFKF